MQSIFTFHISRRQFGHLNAFNINHVMAEINQIFLRRLWEANRRLHLAASEAFEGGGGVENIGLENIKAGHSRLF